jgi:hypothetical protein
MRLTRLATLVLLLLGIPAMAQAQFNYTTRGEAITITGYTGSGGVVIIPGTINGLPVTSIASQAFYGAGVSEVITPDSVTSIGSQAFMHCGALTNVTVGSSVASLGDWAFGDDAKLISVGCRGNPPSLGGNNVFSGDTATVYYLSGATGWGTKFGGRPAVLWNPVVPFFYDDYDGTITIEEYTGSGGGSVSVPAMVDFLPVSTVYGFNYVDNVTNVIIPQGVTGIGEEACYFCVNLANITLPNSLTNIGSRAFYGSGLTRVTIPSGMSSIGKGAFAGCSRLTNAAIPNSVTAIGGGAFIYCYSLNNLAIPNGVTSIGEQAFSSCTSLSGIAIPNSVTNIADGAFYGCVSLTNVALPDELADLPSDTFSGCVDLATITIPTGVTAIGSYCFLSCASLTNVAIPGDVVDIENDAFNGCTGLINVAIPGGVTNIGNLAFADCTNLTAITVNTNNPFYTSTDGVLFNRSQTLLIQFPGGKSGGYAIPDGVTNIGQYAFAWSGNLNTIAIPDSIDGIDSTAFVECTGLKAITVDAGNPSFSSADGTLFNGNQTSLVLFPEDKGGSYIVPNGVTNIGDFAFCNCNGLTNVTIPDTVVSLGYESFAQCAGLTSITIPGSVSSFGGYTFYYCTNLTGIYFEGSPPNLIYDSWNFFDSPEIVVYTLPGTFGWWPSLGWPTTAPWLPQAQTVTNAGGPATPFGFNINWASGQTVVVDACTNLMNPVWQPVQTNTLTTGSVYFSDPQWMNYPGRFYRLRSL